MRIAVMGAGALGAYFGGRLAEAGDEVAFIARGPHLNAIRARGLKVVSALGDIHLKDCLATDGPADIGPVDIVLFTVKLGDMESAAEVCRPLIGDGTVVVPLLNGVEAPDVLARTLGPEHAAGGAAYISARIAEPGVVEHIGDFARMQFGSTDATAQARLGSFLQSCRAAGIEAALVDDIAKTLWEKFTVLLALSTLTTAARTPVGPIREDDNGRATLIAVIEEAAAVAAAMGVAISDDIVEKNLAFLDGLPAEVTASMLVDLKAGKPLEAPWLSGSLIRMGREAGVPTPVNTALYAVILPHVGGRAGIGDGRAVEAALFQVRKR